MSAVSLPGLIRRGQYRRAWLRPDLIAGVTVCAMLVPQSMAYAELGGLPASAGFRAALVALPIYALLGTSRHLGVGPEPGTAILAATAVAGLADGDPERYAALMAALAGIVGLVALLAGVLRLGFLADLLSKPVLVGYITGVGVTLLTSQIEPFTGVPIDADNPFVRIGQLLGRLDQIEWPTLALGAGVLAVILLCRRYRPALPGALLGLFGALAAVALFDLDVPVVGQIEAAWPSLAVPDVDRDDLLSLLPAAAGVALIGFTDNILTARSISVQQGYEVDADRELVALGAMNGAGALSGGFVVSSSASRSFVPASIGARSQLSAVVTFVSLILVLLVGQDVLADIPRTALAAVIIAAGFAVIDLAGFVHIASISRTEAALAAVTCLAVIGADLLVGVVVAVGLSLLVMLGRVARPHDAILGEGKGLDGWIDLDDERATPVEGLMVYRFDAPLFFANANHFAKRVRAAMEANPGEEQGVVLDMEGVGSIDTTAVDALGDLIDELEEAAVDVSLARANDRVLDVLERAGLIERLGEDRVYPTINSAVAAFRRR